MGGIKIIRNPAIEREAAKAREALKATLTSGKKIVVKWSQTRGGIALFVRNRMEGDLFDSEAEAVEFLNDLCPGHPVEIK